MNGHFGRNLYKPLVRFINFIGNYHECNILFIIRPFKMEIYHLQNVSRRKYIVDTVLVKDITCTRQNVITCVVLQFLARLDEVQEELLYYPRRRH